MGLKRFEDFRFVGDRVEMVVYDTSDAEQLTQLQGKVEAGGLADRNLLQTFAPDTPVEARNRGFKPAVR